MTPVASVVLADAPDKAFMHRTRTDDEQVVVRDQPIGDPRDESLQVLQATRFDSALWVAAAARADGGIVSDVAGGPVVSRNLRLHVRHSGLVVMPPGDDGLARVDPHEGAGARHGRVPIVGQIAALQRHDRAQTGPLSAFAARSA